MQYVFQFLKGIVIGVANIIPGVSGGTMAVVLGIYERLISAISGALKFDKKWLGHIIFLALIAAGAVAGLKLLAPVIQYSLDNFFQYTMLFFMGLITGSFPTIFKTAPIHNFAFRHILVLTAGIAVVLLLGASSDAKDSIEASMGNINYPILFISGMLAGAAMIVPGVSGSLVMVLLGVYPTILFAIDELHIPILGLFAIGAGTGVLVFSILIKWLLKRAADSTHAFIYGLVGASIIVLFKGFPEGDISWLIGALVLISGAAIAYLGSFAPEK